MLMKKKKSETIQKIEKASTPTLKKPFVRKAIGVTAILLSTSIFVQGIPLLYVFLGAYLGVPADAKIGDMDSMIWLLTCVTLMPLAVYGFVKWVKYLANRFFKTPSNPLLALVKKGK